MEYLKCQQAVTSAGTSIKTMIEMNIDFKLVFSKGSCSCRFICLRSPFHATMNFIFRLHVQMNKHFRKGLLRTVLGKSKQTVWHLKPVKWMFSWHLYFPEDQFINILKGIGINPPCSYTCPLDFVFSRSVSLSQFCCLLHSFSWLCQLIRKLESNRSICFFSGASATQCSSSQQIQLDKGLVFVSVGTWVKFIHWYIWSVWRALC